MVAVAALETKLLSINQSFRKMIEMMRTISNDMGEIKEAVRELRIMLSKIEQYSSTFEQFSTIIKISSIQPFSCTINPRKTLSTLSQQTSFHLHEIFNSNKLLLICQHKLPEIRSQIPVPLFNRPCISHVKFNLASPEKRSTSNIVLNQESKKIPFYPGGDVEATTLKLGQCSILIDPGGDAGDKSKDGKFLQNPQSYIIEIMCVSFLIVFAINYFTGKRENENLALAWVAKFAIKDSVFEHYSLLGVGEAVGEGDDSSLFLKEGQTMFKFYASSRRYCQGLLATMEPKSRDDLISRLYNRIVTCKDEISFEVYMKDEAMDHVVFALAKKKAKKGMQKELGDLQWYASLMSPPSNRKWIVDELAVITIRQGGVQQNQIGISRSCV